MKRDENNDPNSLQNRVLTVKVSSIQVLMEVEINALNLRKISEFLEIFYEHKVDHKIGHHTRPQ